MKIQLLKEYIMLAETLNFTKTAQALNLTQPVLSRHIQRLEDFFGDELFFRDTHNVKLTTTGILVFSEAKKILKQFENSVSTIHNFTGKAKQKLSIGYLGEAFSHLLVKTIDEFREKYHSVNIDYRDGELDEIINFIHSNEYDVGLILRPNIIDKFDSFNTLPLQTDQLCAIVNKAHPLAGRQSISLKEVAQYPIIREDPKEVSYAEMCSTNYFIKNNIDFTLYKEYPNFRTCLFNIELNKQAVFLLPQHRLHLVTENTVGIEIEGNCYYILELIWNKNNANPNLKKFIQVLKNNILSEK
ncbi:LysR family transcriptional regulator [Lonepinella koalarum]|uniref:DNA-binding transcriptional LysR family regulator n=1 Tax=Lonepinella koalarum TaxID=53417 RepID=A0A4R1KR98_9PAST|nr:LysR family transcriptional regulator [Lonepinella koalarum]MDH2925713.1 LysR family transcriptional regulator [Lonepinella koalarum]TCK67087.1 DNA-binding transcriptional LysR family regulator [Lonepinella koalarum]TFJ88922.1 LysR family transcriptional regulator [Lonepinella koalarum]TYG34922.1 LysR family transcriptional regulator [Lonepinella koalarum]